MTSLAPAERAAREMRKASRTLREAEYLLEAQMLEGAASRAYYAAFHAARALLFLRSKSPKSHRGILMQFSQEFVRPGTVPIEFSAILQQERREREFVDYEAIEGITPADAQRFVADARRFVAAMAKLLRDQTS